MEAELTPLKITNTCVKLIQQIEVEVIQFTNLPVDTPSLDKLAQCIKKKFVFLRNLLTTEIASHSSLPLDSSDIKERLIELETEFSAIVHDNDGSENGSVCEDCLHNDGELEKRDTASEESSVYEVPGVFHELVVPPSETTTMPPCGPKEEKEMSCDCEQKDVGGGGMRRRGWWLKMMAVLTTVIEWNFDGEFVELF